VHAGGDDAAIAIMSLMLIRRQFRNVATASGSPAITPACLAIRTA
jgi:hypothetical protein